MNPKWAIFQNSVCLLLRGRKTHVSLSLTLSKRHSLVKYVKYLTHVKFPLPLSPLKFKTLSCSSLLFLTHFFRIATLQGRRGHPELCPGPGGGDPAAEAVPVAPHRRQEPLLASGYDDQTFLSNSDSDNNFGLIKRIQH